MCRSGDERRVGEVCRLERGLCLETSVSWMEEWVKKDEYLMRVE
jgi:hypothetical protein